jgi:hypothetical protein
MLQHGDVILLADVPHEPVCRVRSDPIFRLVTTPATSFDVLHQSGSIHGRWVIPTRFNDGDLHVGISHIVPLPYCSYNRVIETCLLESLHVSASYRTIVLLTLADVCTHHCEYGQLLEIRVYLRHNKHTGYHKRRGFVYED